MPVETEQEVIQNLRDAGCDDTFIDAFMKCYREGKKKEQLNTLAKHRKCILDKLHESQREIDCLDYLVYQLQKNEYHKEREDLQ